MNIRWCMWWSTHTRGGPNTENWRCPIAWHISVTSLNMPPSNSLTGCHWLRVRVPIHSAAAGCCRPPLASSSPPVLYIFTHTSLYSSSSSMQLISIIYLDIHFTIHWPGRIFLELPPFIWTHTYSFKVCSSKYFIFHIGRNTVFYFMRNSFRISSFSDITGNRMFIR